MGVVIRQGIKQSVVTYLGVLIGAVNVLFIYPLTLEKAQLGLWRFIIDTGTLLMPFMLVGANQISVKFFPYFTTENSNRHNGLLSLLLLIILVSSSVVCLLLYFFKETIYQFYQTQSQAFEPVLQYVIPLAFFYALFMMFYGYAQNFKRIAIPYAINSLYIKIGMPLLAIAYYLEIVLFNTLFFGIFIIYIVINISHLFYLKYLGQLSLNLDFTKYLDKSKFSEIMIYAFYATIGNLGSIIVVRIDSFMVSSFMGEDGLANNGVYTIASFIANAIATPTSAINAITTPLIAQFWKTNDIQQIKILYQKSSLNLIIVGFGLFACICVGLEYLFQIMPKGEEYAIGTMVILILGASKLFDMATSINNPIIAMSAQYKFNFYALIILAILNIIGNYFLIDLYGIEGAAIASFISLFLFNIAKLIFIWWKFKMQPFTWQCLVAIVLAFACFLVAYFIPETNSAILNLIIKCGTVALLFTTSVLALSLSKDLNKVVKQLSEKIIK